MRDSCSSVIVGESASLCTFKRQLIVVDRCLPIQQLCDGTLQPYFTSLSGTSLNNPAAQVTIVNESQCSGCAMTVYVNGDLVSTLGTEGSVSAYVPCLDTIEVLCSGVATETCTGFIQADFFVRVRI